MGYTHYWEMTDIELGEEVIKDIENVLNRNKDLVWIGEIEENNPRVNSSEIFFNGDHETFYVTSGESGFCKTNEKPYDLAVCEVLLVLKHHLGDEFELESDGFYVSSKYELEKEELNNNWGKAIENVKKEFGYEFGLWKKSYYKSESGVSTEDLTFQYEASHDGDFIEYLNRNGSEYYKFQLLPIETYNDKQLENKKGRLFMDKEFELGVVVIDEQQSENGDLHILCERESDGSHVVWTSYNTGDLETSYENFYNGKYDLTREEGYKELSRRVEREKEELKGLENVSLLGSGTIGDRDYYDFVEESPLSTKETIIFIDFDEGEITGEQVAYGSWVALNHEESMEYLNTLDERDIVRSFEHIKSPIQKEKGVEFELER